MRRGSLPLLLTGAVLGVVAGSAAALHVIAAALQTEADAYFAAVSLDGSTVDSAVFRHYNDLSLLGGTLTSVAQPLLFVAVAGSLLLLAVAGQRWDVLHRPPATLE